MGQTATKSCSSNRARAWAYRPVSLVWLRRLWAAAAIRGLVSTPDVLVLESHGDRRIRALLDAHHGFTHSCSNAPAVDLIELAVPWDGVVIGHLPLFDVAQRRRQIVLFTQRSMGVLHSGRFHRQGRIPSWPSSRPPAGLARPGSSAAVLRPPSRLDPVNRTFLLCPNRTLLLCRDNRI